MGLLTGFAESRPTALRPLMACGPGPTSWPVAQSSALAAGREVGSGLQNPIADALLTYIDMYLGGEEGGGNTWTFYFLKKKNGQIPH